MTMPADSAGPGDLAAGCSAPSPGTSSPLSAPANNAYQYVAQEHAELRKKFDALEQIVDRQDGVAEIPQLVLELVAEVRDHFRLEEVDGLFAQIERDAPLLARDVERLRADHAEILAEADGLTAACDQTLAAEGRRHFSHLFRRFRRRFAEHESEENVVLMRAYGLDVGTKD